MPHVAGKYEGIVDAKNGNQTRVGFCVDVEHNLETEFVVVGLLNHFTKESVIVPWRTVGENSVRLIFHEAPQDGQYLVSVIG